MKTSVKRIEHRNNSFVGEIMKQFFESWSFYLKELNPSHYLSKKTQLKIFFPVFYLLTFYLQPKVVAVEEEKKINIYWRIQTWWVRAVSMVSRILVDGFESDKIERDRRRGKKRRWGKGLCE